MSDDILAVSIIFPENLAGAYVLIREGVERERERGGEKRVKSSAQIFPSKQNSRGETRRKDRLQKISLHRACMSMRSSETTLGLRTAIKRASASGRRKGGSTKAVPMSVCTRETVHRPATSLREKQSRSLGVLDTSAPHTWFVASQQPLG